MPSATQSPTASVLAETRAWLVRIVIGLNLCPFAKAVQVRGQIRYAVCRASEEVDLLAALLDELQALARSDPALTDTTLLICPNALADFDDFNQFLGDAEAVLARAGFEGIFQLASFHPGYRFAGTAPDEASNASNRSPYPMLHLLRESSVAHAVAAFPDTAAIFEANIRTLRALGQTRFDALLAQCRADAQASSGTDVSSQA
ncbi:MAG: DUF1415 domain-containing protein [Burkholderiaceae bacterium]